MLKKMKLFLVKQKTPITLTGLLVTHWWVLRD